jgi:hypothetical protein
MNKLRLVCALLLTLGGSLLAQPERSIDPQTDNFIEKRIETLAENSSEEIDFTTVFESLTYYRDHPLELNAASRDELEQLYILSDFQIAALIDYRERFGKLLSIWELQAVPGFDLSTLYILQPFVKVDRDLNRLTISLRDVLKYARQEVVVRVAQNVEQQVGFSDADSATLANNPNARYLGSPQRVFARYRFRYSNNVSIGLTGEKDAGEEFFKGSQKQGFDFYSGHFALRNIGKLKALTLGDFQAQFGQGLTFWTGFGFGKTADAMNIKRSAPGLKPYTSINENLFLRGAGTTWNLGLFDVTAFVSRKKVNTNAASLDSLSQDIQAFTNFNLSGYHRTPGELQDKANIREDIAGGNIAFNKRNLHVGLTLAHMQYSSALQRSDAPYNLFEFSGIQNTNVGVDFNWVYRNLNMFGEVARSANGGLAATGGMIASLDPRLSFSLLHRHFGRNYQAVYTAAIAEGSRSINEYGTLVGMTARPYRGVTLSAYFDHWIYPWLRYLMDAPSRGYDGLVQLSYTPSKGMDMYFRYRDRIRVRNTTSDMDAVIDFPLDQHQQNYRFDIIYKISASFKLRNRIEFCRFTPAGAASQNGVVVLQDVIYKPMLTVPVSFSARYALFRVENYNARIYSYENDMLYSFSIPAYSNNGSRAYLNMEWNLGRKIDVWFRYARYFYTNVSETGSGLTAVQGPVRSDFRVQMRLRF